MAILVYTEFSPINSNPLGLDQTDKALQFIYKQTDGYISKFSESKKQLS